MRSRLLAGWRGLFVASAVASLVLFPAVLAGEKPTTVIDHGTTGFGPNTGTDEEDSIRRPHMYSRANYVWPFATGPRYGLFDVKSSELRKPGMLHTQVGVFDLTRGMPELPEVLRATNRMGELGAQYFLVSLHTDALSDNGVADFTEVVEAAGGRIVGTKPVAAFVALLTENALVAVQSHSGVIGVVPYHPALKINPMVGRVPLTDPYKAVSDVYSLDVRLFAGESAGPVAEAIAKIGGNVRRVSDEHIIVDLHRDDLAALAALEPVARITESVPMFPKGEESSTVMQTGDYNSGNLPYHAAGVDGSGSGFTDGSENGTGPNGEQLLMVLDTGIQLDAGDLSHSRTDPGDGFADSTHRKVQGYFTDIEGMNGDLLGCDSTASGGVTHGHTVSVTALGNATILDEGTYGDNWQLEDPDNAGSFWNVDGVAPGARLLAYDAQETPNVLSCDDPGAGGLSVGDTYRRTFGDGSLFHAFDRDARLANFSWGSEADPTYDTQSERIDQFMFDHKDAAVFVAAGNEGQDTAPPVGVPDAGSISTPATAKNAIIIGASRTTNQAGSDQRSRAPFTSVGPAVPADSLLRVAPILMAPGDDFGANTGIDSEYHCRSTDNEQTAPVECEIALGQSGTSFASPAAAGAGLLVRDYFYQGMYPDGTTGNIGNAGDQQDFISGALLKAVLIASAEFMDPTDGGFNLSEGFRFNNEQGYGRIQLDRILPAVNHPSSPTGLIVADHGQGVFSGPNNTSLSTLATNDNVDTYQFEVNSDQQELRIACAWVEDVPNGGDGMLDNDIDLELVAPDAVTTYFGNIFTEDKDRDNVLDGGEDCDGDGEITEGAWSLDGTGVTGCTANGTQCQLTCSGIPQTFLHDNSNPTEAIMLSPDPEGDGIDDDPETAEDEGADNMIQTGMYTLRVAGRTIVESPGQLYSCAISGPVALGSSVRLDKASYVCNDESSVTVGELDPNGNDADLDTPPDSEEEEIGRRTVIEVIDVDGVTVNDTEGCALDPAVVTGGNGATAVPCLTFDKPIANAWSYKLTTPMVLTDGLLRAGPSPGPNATWYNGVIDVRSGETLRVTYFDEDNTGGAGSRDATQERENTSVVGCDVSIGIGGFTWTQFGLDTAVLVDGGCERDARGLFTFGHPDRYMDADEKVGYRIVVQSTEADIDLNEATATLRCVEADANSPADCQPGSPATAACPDPDRLDNGPCETGGTPWLTILDSPKRIGFLPANNFVSINFAVEMAAEGDVPATQEIDMLLGLSASSSGKGVEGVVASRHILEADENALNYNTDFPTSGVENRDYLNDEVLENPITVPGGSVIGNDYRFETATWDNMQATGRNTLINVPWDFEANDGGFIVGLHTATDLSITSVIVNWGEDLNFNGILDGGEDRDPQGQTSTLDRNWNTRGGCGWQTNNDPFNNALPGGVWHTGTIDVTTLASCFGPGASRRCQSFETVGGLSGLRSWIELVKTPVIEKVNQCGPGRCNNGLSVNTCETTQDCLDQGDVGPCLATADPLCGSRRDQPGKPVFDVRFIDWGWNMALDLPDTFVTMTWEFDTDIADTSQSNLDAFPVLNLMSGPQGAIAGGNAPITDGFQNFAPNHVCQGNPGIVCSSQSDCDPPNFTPSIGPCIDTFASTAGKRGLNRVGRNSCFFDSIANALPSGLAKPVDNDQNKNGLCDGDGTTSCRTGNADLDCTDAGTTGPCNPIPGVCVADSTFTNGEWVGGTPCATDSDCQLAALNPRNCSAQDTYLTPAGPIRNMDIQKVNGPDMRLTTLEDIYGLSGEAFQGAIGIINDEGTATAPTTGFGIALDDMFVSWSEVELTADNTECDPGMGGGSCASIEIEQTRIFEGSTTVSITILDASPYDSANPGDLNDCNLDGTFDNTDDCNLNGTPDIVARASSESLDEEVLILDEISPGVYTAKLSVSAAYDVDGDPDASPPVPGVLFLSASGTDNPAVIIQYTDRDDGTGNVCPNDTDPAVAGTIQSTSTVFLTRGTVIVKGARLENPNPCTTPGVEGPVGCDGDDDAFADTNETINMFLTLINNTGIDLNRVVARVNSPDLGDKIDCILTPFVAVGPMAEDEELEVADPIVFKVADVSRVGLNDDFTATFDVTMSADEFDALLRTQDVSLPLDLNVLLNNGSPVSVVEGFEGGSVAASIFEADEIDNIPGPDQEDLLLQSDGHRCQYNDCDGPNPNGGPDNPNCPDCYMGFLPASGNNADDWHVHTTNDPDGGRAFAGNNSLHWGLHAGSGLPDDDSSRLKSLEAVFTTNPINLDVDAIPEMTFKHQISLMDSRGSNTPAGESVDRGVVHIQLADGATGNPVGVWEKAFPYENVYDVQGTDAFINCKFDPTDDGDDEDDYFDPGDPLRRLGPSSTCFPEFVYGYQGDTDWRNDFDEEALGRSDGPALPGSIDRGTWIETKFNLATLIGRRIRVRFLTTSIEVGDAVDHMAANITDPGDPEDDGWYIDEFSVTGAVDQPVLLGVDSFANGWMPGCGNNCGTVNADLTADPAALPAPGQVTELSAAASDAPQGCTGGVLQYQFWTDEDLNGVLGDAADILLRDWTDNATFVSAPQLTTNFGVRVRCSSDIDNESCNDSVVLQVPVTCPSAVAFKGADEPMTEKIRFAANKTDLQWNTIQFVDFVEGDLVALKAGGSFTGTVAACFANDANVNTLGTGGAPGPGGATYYVGRGRSLALTACNEIGGYGSTGTDAVDRNAQINADGNACP